MDANEHHAAKEEWANGRTGEWAISAGKIVGKTGSDGFVIRNLQVIYGEE
jgi:hypothetical protein